jgi:hypothetical protein
LSMGASHSWFVSALGWFLLIIRPFLSFMVDREAQGLRGRKTHPSIKAREGKAREGEATVTLVLRGAFMVKWQQ